MNSTRPLWLILAPFVFLILWSAGFGVAKLGLQHAPPMTLLALRYVLVLLALAPLALLIRVEWPRRWQAVAHVAVVGFLIQVVYFACCYMAFRAGASAGAVAIIVCLQPILAALAAPAITGAKGVGGWGWLGLGLGLAGAAITVAARSAIAVESVAGLVLSVMGLLGMTTATLYEKRFGASMHPIPANLIQYAVGAAFCVPLALLTESPVIDWTPEFVAVMVYLVVGNSIIAIGLLLAMIRAGEVARVSALFFLVPPLAALFAWPMLGEAMPPLAWAGMGLAALGVALVSRKR